MNANYFPLNDDLIQQSRAVLADHPGLRWVIGGAGSGKSTICRALSERLAWPIYDMDAHIYGAYHERFSEERHPVNKAWTTAPNGLAWLLDMSWAEFSSFNEAALPEYLDLFTMDLISGDYPAGLLIDGGICDPALLARAVPAQQIICLANPGQSSVEIWEQNEERLAMKAFIYQLPEPAEKWQRFLEFDAQITQKIIKECQENNITICSRTAAESVEKYATRVSDVLDLNAQ